MLSKPFQPPMTLPSQSGDRVKDKIPHINLDRSPFSQDSPVAYHQQSGHSQPRASPISYVLSPRQHGSVSSGGTASSTASNSKINHRPYTFPYYMASHAEQGHMFPPRFGQMNVPIHTTTPQSMSDTQRRIRDDNSAIFTYIQEQEGQVREDDHAISVLAFLSILDPFYSAFAALYSLLIGLLFLICSPICICNKSFSPRNGIIRSLAPLLEKHLQYIHADSRDELHTLDFSAIKLVLVYVIIPFLSIGVAISAWVAACFWLFALIMGNPDGTERGDDGRATVLNLRDWWGKFLLSPTKRR